jgi:hypothetical protein
MASSTVDGVEFLVISEPRQGELVSGDCHLVVGGEEGVLVVVIDALGHGTEAAEVVEKALPVIRQAPDPPSTSCSRRSTAAFAAAGAR